MGRFSTRDVLFGDPMAPVSLNQFVYGAGDPVSNIDLDGLCAQPDICGPTSQSASGRKTQAKIGRAAVQTQSTYASSYTYYNKTTYSNYTPAATKFTPPKPRPPKPPARPSIGRTYPDFGVAASAGSGPTRFGIFRDSNRHLKLRPNNPNVGRPAVHWDNSARRIEWDDHNKWHFNDDKAPPGTDKHRGVTRGLWELAKYGFLVIGKVGEVFIVPPTTGEFLCESTRCNEKPDWQPIA